MNKNPLSEDEYADELVRMHLEIKDRKEDEPHVDGQCLDDVPEHLESAKKVIELLARVRPALTHAPDTQPTGAGFTDTPASAKDSRANSDIPSKIGRFEVRSLIGQGGFGLVFLAMDPKLGREVAIKVPQLGALLDSESQTRFQREGRALARLNHPGIVPIYEVGNDGAITYIVSEYVKGTDLARLVKSIGSVHDRAAAKLTLDLTRAIQHAHERGVIHRDLKPANVLLKLDDFDSSVEKQYANRELNEAQVQITDFGLAKLSAEADKNLTQSGSLIGTPAFAAPEQLKSDGQEDSTVSADIYSIGALLYYIAAGVAPFESENFAQTVQEVQHRDPTPLFRRDNGIAKDLSAICMKCLQKLPSDRYTTANDLCLDLQRFLDNKPVHARSLPIHQRALRWSMNNKLVSALIFVTAFSVVVGGLVSTRFALDLQRSEQSLRDQYLDSKQTIDEYFVTVSEDPVFGSGAFESTRRNLLDAALVHYQKLLDKNLDDPNLTADSTRIELRLGDAAFDAGDYTQALRKYERAQKIASDLQAADTEAWRFSLIISMSELRRARLAAAENQNDEAQKLFAKATVDLASLYADRADEQAILFELSSGYLNYCNSFMNQSDFEAADKVCRLQERLLLEAQNRSALSPTLSNQLAMCLGTRARIAGRLNNASSLELFKQSIDISRQLMTEMPTAIVFAEVTANTLNSRAILLANRGQLEQAEQDLVEAVRILDSISLVNTKPEFIALRINTKNTLAGIFGWRNKVAEGEEISREIVRLSRQLIASHGENEKSRFLLLRSLLGHASNLTLLHRHEEAIAVAQELASHLAAGTRGSSEENISRLTASNLTVLAKLAYLQQRHGEAKILDDQAIAIREKLLSSRPNDPRLKSELSVALESRAFNLAQLELFQEAVKDRQRVIELEGMSGDLQQLFLADALVQAGQLEEAEEIIRTIEAQSDEQGRSSGISMQIAFVRAGLAIARSAGNTELLVELRGEENNNLQKAVEEFQQAVKGGFFYRSPYKVDDLDMRDDLKLFFDLPPIRSTMELQRAIWANSSHD